MASTSKSSWVSGEFSQLVNGAAKPKPYKWPEAKRGAVAATPSKNAILGFNNCPLAVYD